MTPTKTKASNPLAQLEKLEAEAAKAKAHDSEISRELHAKTQRFHALHDERRRLIHREPGLVDHHDKPMDDNAIAAIDREVAGLGDIGELHAKEQHCRRLTERAQRQVRDFIVANIPATFDGLRPEAERVTDALHAALAAAAEAQEAYLAMVQRLIGITHQTDRAVDPRWVPGLDQAAELGRVLKGWQLPVPIPEVPR